MTVALGRIWWELLIPVPAHTSQAKAAVQRQAGQPAWVQPLHYTPYSQGMDTLAPQQARWAWLRK